MPSNQDHEPIDLDLILKKLPEFRLYLKEQAWKLLREEAGLKHLIDVVGPKRVVEVLWDQLSPSDRKELANRLEHSGGESIGPESAPRKVDRKLESTLHSISVIVEEDVEEARRIDWPISTDVEIRKAVVAAIAVLVRDRPATVEWASTNSVPLDGKPWFGRCIVCDRWVFDSESDYPAGADGVCRGAKVDGQFRCDSHLPSGHPLCFGGRGYDGPVPGGKVSEK